jgi:D-alanine-D-alanine ligase
VLVLFGGRSSEHAISCLSARSVIRALVDGGATVLPVGITPDGRWFFDPTDDGSDLPHVAPNNRPVDLRLCPPALVLDGHPMEFDVVFPVLHGPWGEDGSVQGLFETMGVPLVGSGVLASAAVMDKPTMKVLLAEAGLPVGSWRLDDLGDLDFPVFVKPARGGSSVGISRVDDRQAYEQAVVEARRHDPRIIVEAAVTGAREIECGVIVQQTPRASRCGEIVVSDGFYDFDAKYVSHAAHLVVPADLPTDVEERIQHLAVQAFEATGCEGLARVDFFLMADGTILINEVNTMPGFTDISLFPRMWAASGIDYPTLVHHLVHDALTRGAGLRNPRRS